MFLKLVLLFFVLVNSETYLEAEVYQDLQDLVDDVNVLMDSTEKKTESKRPTIINQNTELNSIVAGSIVLFTEGSDDPYHNSNSPVYAYVVSALKNDEFIFATITSKPHQGQKSLGNKDVSWYLKKDSFDKYYSFSITPSYVSLLNLWKSTQKTAIPLGQLENLEKESKSFSTEIFKLFCENCKETGNIIIYEKEYYIIATCFSKRWIIIKVKLSKENNSFFTTFSEYASGIFKFTSNNQNSIDLNTITLQNDIKKLETLDKVDLIGSIEKDKFDNLRKRIKDMFFTLASPCSSSSTSSMSSMSSMSSLSSTTSTTPTISTMTWAAKLSQKK